MLSNFSYIKQKISIFLLLYIILLKKSLSQFFKSYQLASGDILIIDSTGIQVQNKTTKKISSIKNISLDIGQNGYNISISQFPSEKNGVIFCYIKNSLYVISSDFEKICNSSLEIAAYREIIIPYDIISENYHYYICFLTTEKTINIQEYYYNINSCTNTLKNSNSVKPTNSLNGESELNWLGNVVDCELMYNDIITCFIQNTNPSEIATVSFNLSNNLTKEANYCSTTEKNNVANVISFSIRRQKKSFNVF